MKNANKPLLADVKRCAWVGIMLLVCLCGTGTQKRPAVSIPPISRIVTPPQVPPNFLSRNLNDSKTTNCNLDTNDPITLSWDATANYLDTVLFYQLFYSHPGDTNWTLLKDSIKVSDSPSVQVHRSDVDAADSIFYFGVLCVTREGVRSDLHVSTDSTASNGGWCLTWIRKK
jgi:hypothetical protein